MSFTKRFAAECSIFVGSLFAVIIPCVNTAAASVELVTDGTAKAVIVAGTGGCVGAAQRELIAHVESICGVTLTAVIPEQGTLLEQIAPGQTVILLGNSVYTEQLGIKGDELQPDGFVLRTGPGWLAIVGNDAERFHFNYDYVPASAGTLYGVYRFLEDLGVRWFFPGDAGTVVPQLSNIVIDSLDISDGPYFPYRFEGYGQYQWRRRIGAGGDRDAWATRHTFAQRYNWQELFTVSHPEYFCMNDEGKLSNDLYQIAFPHPGVIDEIVNQAREYFSSSRPEGQKYFLVVPNDWFSEMCACSQCQSRIDMTRPSGGIFSDYVAEAVVQVAKAVKDEFPDCYIVYCAYEHYKLPPQNIERLPSNVVILLAQPRSGFYTNESIEAAYENIRAWQDLQPASIYFCRYYRRGGVVMKPIPHIIAEDVRRMKQVSEEHASVRLGGEMNFFGTGSWWVYLNIYVTSKMLWNPQLDVDELLADYYEKCFGPASEPMQLFISSAERYHVENPDSTLYPPEMREVLAGHIEQAIELAADTEYQARVAYIKDDFDTIMGQTQLQEARLARVEGAEDTSHEPIAAPILQYDFNVSLSSVAMDSSGNDQQGIIYGARRVPGKTGKALSFDGQDDYLLLREPLLLNDEFTVTAWIKLEYLDAANVVAGELVNHARPYHIFGSPAVCHLWDRLSLSIRGDELVFQDKELGRARSNHVQLNADIWYHVAITYSRTEGMSVYLNGQLIGFNVPRSLRPEDSTVPLLSLVGATGGVSSRAADVIADCRWTFDGIMDDFTVYSVALSSAQLRALSSGN